MFTPSLVSKLLLAGLFVRVCLPLRWQLNRFMLSFCPLVPCPFYYPGYLFIVYRLSFYLLVPMPLTLAVCLLIVSNRSQVNAVCLLVHARGCSSCWLTSFKYAFMSLSLAVSPCGFPLRLAYVRPFVQWLFLPLNADLISISLRLHRPLVVLLSISIIISFSRWITLSLYCVSRPWLLFFCPLSFFSSCLCVSFRCFVSP
jgi:hypothetical protein